MSRIGLGWKFVLSSGGLLAGLAAAEAVLRVFLPQELITPHQTVSYGSIYGYQPGLRIKHKTPYFDVAYTINGLGLRGREYARVKPAGTRRILCLGDSFTFGHGVGDTDTFAYRLEEKLSKWARRIKYEVINMGIGGIGLPEYERLYRTLGAAFDPDLVVVNFYSNDLAFDLPSVGADSARAETAPSSAEPARRLQRVRNLMRRLPGYVFLCEESHLWALLRRVVSGRVAAFYADRVRAARAIPGAEQGTAQRERLGIAVFDALIDRACASRRRVLVLSVNDELSRYRALYAHLRGRARRSACGLGILEIEVRPEQRLSPMDAHWNPSGHACVADALFTAITRSAKSDRQ